jgi:hypothetical protein
MGEFKIVALVGILVGDDSSHFAKNINDDFIDFGGVERGPDARNCCSELFFWYSTLLCILSSLVVFYASGASPGGSRRCQAASRGSLKVRGSPKLQNGRLRALGEA